MSEIRYNDIFNNIESWLGKIISRKLNLSMQNSNQLQKHVREKVHRSIMSEVLPHLRKILKENNIHEDKLRNVWENKMRADKTVRQVANGLLEDSIYFDAGNGDHLYDKQCGLRNSNCNRTPISRTNSKSKLSTLKEKAVLGSNGKVPVLESSDFPRKLCYEWIKHFINYVFDQECRSVTDDSSESSNPQPEVNYSESAERKIYGNELDSVLLRSLSDKEKDFVNKHFADLLPGALEEMIEDKPTKPKKYLGRYILLNKYSEIREDLNANDIEHLVELRQNEVKGLAQMSPNYLCKLLNDKKLFQKPSSRYRFELKGKVKVVRGKRLQPKVKKICDFFIEKTPSQNLSKKMRQENINKEFKMKLSDLLMTLQREVFMIKQSEKTNIYEEIIAHLAYVLPELSDVEENSCDLEDRKSSADIIPKRSNTAMVRGSNLGAIASASERSLKDHRLHMEEEFGIDDANTFHNKTPRAHTAPLTSCTYSPKDRGSFLPPLHKTEPNLIASPERHFDISLDDKSLNSFNVQSAARSKAFASYSVDSLPSVQEEQKMNLIKVHRLAPEQIIKLLEEVEDIINNKALAIESLKLYESNFVQSEMTTVLHNILEQQYQDKITKTFNYKDILEEEVLPLLDTVLEFDNEDDKYVLGDQIKVYLKQMIQNMTDDMLKKKSDELGIAHGDIMKMLTLFLSNTRSISSLNDPSECTCVEKIIEAETIGSDHEDEEESVKPSDIVVGFYKVAFSLEELSVNYKAMDSLLKCSKHIIKSAAKKRYVTSKTINDVEHMVRLCKQIFRIAQPPEEEMLEFVRANGFCGGCVLRRSCSEIGRVLERADRMFELRRLQQKEELQSEIDRMFSAFVTDPCSSRRHRNIVYSEPAQSQFS